MNISIDASEKISLSLSECELLTSLSRATLNRAIESGDLGSVRIGRRRVVPRQDLLDFIERRRTHVGEASAA